MKEDQDWEPGFDLEFDNYSDSSEGKGHINRLGKLKDKWKIVGMMRYYQDNGETWRNNNIIP